MANRLFLAFILGAAVNIPGTLFAQQETLNGLIVTNAGDTLRGYIQKEKNLLEYTTCSFKEKLDGQFKTYLPADIRLYYSPSIGLMVSQSTPVGTLQNHVFLKRIANGKIRLYKFEVPDQKTYLIQKDNGPLEQLIMYTTQAGSGKSTRTKSDQYKAQLHASLSDCQLVQKSIDKLDASEDGLVDVISTYNTCSGEAKKPQPEKQPWTVAHAGMTAGIVHSSFSPESNPGTAVINSVSLRVAYGSTYTYHAGAFVDFDFVRRQRNQSFRIEALYFTANYQSSSTFSWGTESGEVNIQQLKFPLTFKQGLSKTKVKPYLLGGISLSFYLNASSRLVQNVTSTGTTTTENTYKFSTNPIGYFAGIGLKLPLSAKTSAFMEMRGELTSEITNLSMNAGLSF